MICRACRSDEPCGCPDALYQGTVIVDDRSEPGSWALHIRDTEPMRNPAAPCHDLGGGVHSASAALSGEAA